MQSTLSEFTTDRATPQLETDTHTIEDECSQLVQRVADDIGHSPTMREFNENSPTDSLTAMGLVSRCGCTWNELKKEAGLEQTHKKGWTEKECIDALKYVEKHVDDEISISVYDDNRYDSAPASRTIRNIFATWEIALEEANIQKKRLTPELCIHCIQQVESQIGESPTVAQYTDLRPEGAPSIGYITSEFGSWVAAKNAAGLSRRTWSSSWTTEDCIEAVQNVGQELGETPTMRKYDDYKPEGAPSAQSIFEIVGSWSKAQRQAGMVDTKTRVKVSEDECIDALRHVKTSLNQSPSAAQYNKHRPDWAPSGRTIRNIFGSWDTAKRTAGLETFTLITKKDCYNAIRSVKEIIGRSPYIRDYDEHHPPDCPGSETIKRVCGSWHDAKVGAGLETYNYSSEDCLNALTAVSGRLGYSPTVNEYDQNRLQSEPFSNTIRQHFGTWNDAKRLSGLMLYNSGESISFPYGPKWKQISQEIRERDGCCVLCGLTSAEHYEEYNRAFDVHHIQRLASFYEDLPDPTINKIVDRDHLSEQTAQTIKSRAAVANHPSNLVSLCRPCHKHVEGKPVEWQVEKLEILPPTVAPDDIVA